MSVNTEHLPATLTPHEFATELRIGYRTALDLIHRGDVPALKIGRHYRIRRSDLDALRTDAR